MRCPVTMKMVDGALLITNVAELRLSSGNRMMTAKITVTLMAAISLASFQARAAEVLLTFDTAPTFESPQLGTGIVPLLDGEWGTQEDGIDNNAENDPFGPTPVPIWNSGEWVQPIGTESPTNNRGPLGPNSEGLDPFAIKTNIFTGVIIFNGTGWGDVSTATHVTLDVKGSFAGSGGLTVVVGHDEDITVFGEPGSASWWSLGANASDVSVGANPGDVTDWTTILVPINRPTLPDSGNSPPDPGEEGASGNWTSSLSGSPFDSWDSVFADVNVIAVRGLTPDSQIDNLGFVFPDAGLTGDFDGDGDVDGADFLEWQRDQTGRTLSDWETNYGGGGVLVGLSAVPEPCSFCLALASFVVLLGARRYQS